MVRAQRIEIALDKGDGLLRPTFYPAVENSVDPEGLLAADGSTLLYRDTNNTVRVQRRYPIQNRPPPFVLPLPESESALSGFVHGDDAWIVTQGVGESRLLRYDLASGALAPQSSRLLPPLVDREFAFWPNRALWGLADRAALLDLSAPPKRMELDVLDQPETIRRIAVGGNIAWIAWADHRRAGLSAIDVSDSGRLVDLGSVPTDPGPKVYDMFADETGVWLIGNNRAIRRYELFPRREPGPTPSATHTVIPGAASDERVFLPWSGRRTDIRNRWLRID